MNDGMLAVVSIPTDYASEFGFRVTILSGLESVDELSWSGYRAWGEFSLFNDLEGATMYKTVDILCSCFTHGF